MTFYIAVHRNFNTIDVGVFPNTKEIFCIARQHELLTIHNTEKKWLVHVNFKIQVVFLEFEPGPPAWKLTKRATKPNL